MRSSLRFLNAPSGPCQAARTRTVPSFSAGHTWFLRSRRALTLVEILVVFAILCTLALSFVQMLVSNKKKLSGMPRRLMALYYAYDLLEERLDLPSLSAKSTITRRPLIQFWWIANNIDRVAISETGARKERIGKAREFMLPFWAEAKVVAEVPGRRFKVTVTVDWKEDGHPESVVLVSRKEK